MSLCPRFPLVTHLHSSAHLGATCSRWGTSSGTSPGHSHTRGRTASLLGLAGTLHTHLRLSRNGKTWHYKDETPCTPRTVYNTLWGTNVCFFLSGCRQCLGPLVLPIEHLGHKRIWGNCRKNLLHLKKTTELWGIWMLISLWPLKKIILLVTYWLHRLLSFVTILITRGVRVSGIQGSFQQ